MNLLISYPILFFSHTKRRCENPKGVSLEVALHKGGT